MYNKGIDRRTSEFFRRKRFIIPTAALILGAAAFGAYEATRPNPGEVKEIELVSTYEGEHGADRGYRNLGFSGIYGYNNKNLPVAGALELECTRGSAMTLTTVTVSATAIAGYLYLDARLPSVESSGDAPCTSVMDAITPSDAAHMMGEVLHGSFGDIAEADSDQTNNGVSYTYRELTSQEQVACSQTVLQGARSGMRVTYPC